MPSSVRHLNKASMKAMSRRANKRQRSAAPSVEAKTHGGAFSESSQVNMLLPGKPNSQLS